MTDIRQKKKIANGQVPSGDDLGQMFNDISSPVNGLLDEHNVSPDAYIVPTEFVVGLELFASGNSISFLATSPCKISYIQATATALSSTPTVGITGGTGNTLAVQLLAALTTYESSSADLYFRRGDLITIFATGGGTVTLGTVVLEGYQIIG